MFGWLIEIPRKHPHRQPLSLLPRCSQRKERSLIFPRGTSGLMIDIAEFLARSFLEVAGIYRQVEFECELDMVIPGSQKDTERTKPVERSPNSQKSHAHWSGRSVRGAFHHVSLSSSADSFAVTAPTPSARISYSMPRPLVCPAQGAKTTLIHLFRFLLSLPPSPSLIKAILAAI